LLGREEEAFSAIKRSSPSPRSRLIASLFNEALSNQHADVVSNLFVRDGNLSLELDCAPRPFAQPQEDLVPDRMPENFEDARISAEWQSNLLNHFYLGR